MNFGIVYGISAFSLSQDIGVTVAEAKAYMEAYFATFPGVRQYMDSVVAQAKEQGYVETLFHRRRELPEIRSSNFNLRSFGERVALLEEEMEQVVSLSVPLTAEAHWGKNWLEAKG